MYSRKWCQNSENRSLVSSSNSSGQDTFLWTTIIRRVWTMDGATGGVGDNAPTFGTSGVQGVQGAGAVQWIWSLLLGLMFINVTTRQQISMYSIGPYWYLLACTPHLEKWGTIFFRSLRSRILFCTSHLKIRGGAHGLDYTKNLPTEKKVST